METQTDIQPSMTSHIALRLSDVDGNAFAILCKARRAILGSNIENKTAVWGVIQSEATSGDYEHLLQTMAKWFNVS
jgi:hypothetical protein